MKLNYKRTILVGFAFFLISAFWQAYDAIIPLALTNHFGLDQFWSGAIMALDNILAVFMLPIFGAISDKVNTKFGKRTPFILVGTVLAIISFVALSVIDGIQLDAIANSDIPQLYAETEAMRKEAYELMAEARHAGDASLVEVATAKLEEVDAKFVEIAAMTFEYTKEGIGLLVGFIGVLLMVLISMATFRSPAVALMPDVTIKPLRSKGNAIINLMGTAGGIIVLVLGMLFKTNKIYMSYVGYVTAVVSVMAAGLIIFLLTVKEKQWSEEMAEETKRLGLDEEANEEKKEDNGVRIIAEKKDGKLVKQGGLSKEQFTSLMLILASVALWYIGYNSITSKYSVYATRELGFSYNETLIIAQAAAIVAYIPVGIISSKIGRKKAILSGIVMLTAAFTLGNFVTPITPSTLMYPIFILAGIGWATINVNSFPMVVELAKGTDVGKYTGYYYTASMAAQIVAPMLSGALYNVFGMRNVFFIFGAIFVALSFVTMFFVKHGDSRPDAKSVVEDALAGGDD